MEIDDVIKQRDEARRERDEARRERDRLGELLLELLDRMALDEALAEAGLCRTGRRVYLERDLPMDLPRHLK